jgi:hypothetical protein
MRHRILQFCRDSSGALLATEWVLVATILVLAAAASLAATRQSVLAQLSHAFTHLH